MLDHLKPSQPIDDRSLVNTHVARVEVQPDQLVIQLAEPSSTLEVPWQKTPARRRREILLPAGIRPEHVWPSMAGSPTAWASLASATCRRNGPGSTRCSAFLGNNHTHTNRVSVGCGLRVRKANFATETKVLKPFQ